VRRHRQICRLKIEIENFIIKRGSAPRAWLYRADMPGSPKRQKATRKYEVYTAPFTAHWRAHVHCSAGLQGVQVLVPTGRPRKHPLLCPAPPSSKDAMTSLTAPAAAPRSAVPAPTDHCGGDACSKRGRKCRLRTLKLERGGEGRGRRCALV